MNTIDIYGLRYNNGPTVDVLVRGFHNYNNVNHIELARREYERHLQEGTVYAGIVLTIGDYMSVYDSYTLRQR